MNTAQAKVEMKPAEQPVQTPAQAPFGTLQRKCACGGTAGASGSPSECPECKKKKTLQRRATGSAGPDAAPPIVNEVLRSPGQPLDARTRAFMEPRFGHDFSKVRVHTDQRASESARAVNALAYTVGSDIAFLGGQYSPQSRRGARTLAHELSHVVQQARGGGTASQPLAVGSPNDNSEIEAERAAETALSGGHYPIQEQVPLNAVQRLTCESILNAEESRGETEGTEVERQVRTDLVSQLMPKTMPISIPGASASLLRTEECGGFQHIAVPGTGFPDLTYLNGRVIELAEVKIGTWQCLDLAERQVNNYVNVGNTNESLKKSLGIDRFELMPTSRFTPSQLQTHTGTPVNVAWCEPGVIVYKAAKKTQEETFLCNAISDKGAVDRFLDRVTGQAETAVDRYISQTITPVINQAIEAGLKKGNLNIPPAVLENLISQVKSIVLEKLRQAMKAQLRESLQASLNALCVATAVNTAISMKDLLKKLDEQMGELVLVPALIQIAQQLATAIAQEILETLKAAGIAIKDVIVALGEAIGAALVALAAYLGTIRALAILAEIAKDILIVLAAA
jgi:hypothetical protein